MLSLHVRIQGSYAQNGFLVMPYFRHKYSELGAGFGRRNAGTDYPGGDIYLRGVQGERIQPQKERGLLNWDKLVIIEYVHDW